MLVPQGQAVLLPGTEEVPVGCRLAEEVCSSVVVVAWKVRMGVEQMERPSDLAAVPIRTVEEPLHHQLNADASWALWKELELEPVPASEAEEEVAQSQKAEEQWTETSPLAVA